MTLNTFRRTTATLLVTFVVLVAGAPPASAFTSGRHLRTREGITVEPLSRLLHFLASFLDCAGIGMDPNGRH